MATLRDNPVSKNAIPNGAQRADGMADSHPVAHSARPPQPSTDAGASGHGWWGNQRRASAH